MTMKPDFIPSLPYSIHNRAENKPAENPNTIFFFQFLQPHTAYPAKHENRLNQDTFTYMSAKYKN
jgi:hypothetical protein